MAIYTYVRCSTLSQMEENGFQMQYDVINKYCKDNEIAIDGSFEDAGISGTVYERYGLFDLLTTMTKGDKVIVQNTSRLWRDETVKFSIVKEIRDIGADIISIEQRNYSVYSKDPEDIFFNAIMEAVDAYEKNTIVRKLYKGRVAKVKSGNKSSGKAPIGYKWENRKYIVIDTDKADIVRMIYESYINLHSIGKVTELLNSLGYKTNTESEFTNRSVNRILRNDFYIGNVRLNDTTFNGEHEPIISKEQFEMVQTILNR